MTLYTPAHFRVDDPAALYEFVSRNAFGTLVSSAPSGLDISHIPFLPERDAHGAVRLLGHVARANAQWQALEGASHLVAIFQGPHGYVSPSWYRDHPAVPTWNYAVVHAHGKARLMDEPELHDLVVRLSNTYEAGRPEPWRATGLPQGLNVTEAYDSLSFMPTMLALTGRLEAVPSSCTTPCSIDVSCVATRCGIRRLALGRNGGLSPTRAARCGRTATPPFAIVA